MSENKKTSKMVQYLDWIYIVITFGAFLFLGSIMFFFLFSTLSILAEAYEDVIIHGSYIIATMLSAWLGMLAIGRTTRNRYPTVCAIVCALGSAIMLARLLGMYAEGGVALYQVVALTGGAVCCGYGAWRYQTKNYF